MRGMHAKDGSEGADGLWLAVVSMAVVVTASNILVQYPINDYLTYGAFTYPASFLVTDLTTRLSGPHRARRVAWIGFALAVGLSVWLSEPRIALASGAAFITGQLLDIAVFQRLRNQGWWQAPLASSSAGSVVDTVVFFGFAFAGTGLPVLSMMAGDLAVKLALAVVFLAPFRAVVGVALRRSPA